MNYLPPLLLDSVLAIVPLLDPVPEPSDVRPGWGAALLVLGLIVATVLLWFSMRKQLGRIRFKEDEELSSSDPASPEVRREDGPGPSGR